MAQLEVMTLENLTQYHGLNKTYIDNSVKAIDDKAVKNAEDIAILIGEDADKSIRTIANEELLKQLIPENASESLDTLEEIAAWIAGHPDDTSAMNKAITDLQEIVGEGCSAISSDSISALFAN